VVEGFGTTFEKDQLQNAVEVAQNITSQDSHRSDPCFSQPQVSIFIRRWIVAEAVAGAINFDAQASILAVEVQHVRTRRMLPPELQSVRAKPKLLPKHDLR
jgi:hypothetical protein